MVAPGGSGTILSRMPRSLALIAVAALILVAGLAVLWPPRPVMRVTAVVPAAAGVREGVPVFYRGIDVGRVGRIALADSAVKITLEIARADVPLRASDTVAFATLGLFGDKVVDLRPGPLDAPKVADGG